MEEGFSGELLRDRLIAAGMQEIAQHGPADFSLRRVASSCGASCAAPYKHFKNKDAFFLEILRFVNRQWSLLEQQLTDIYGGDKKRLLCELCLANIRFRVVNPHFRAVLTMNEQALTAQQRQEIGRSTECIALLCGEVFGAAADAAQFRLQAIVYGTTMLIGSGAYTDTEKTVLLARQAVEDIIHSAP